MQVIKQNYEKYLGANPYIGFLPFMGEYNLDHSMEFLYFPLNKIQTDKNFFNFTELDKCLNQIFSRKHTCVLRIYLDYPSKPSGFPNFYFKYATKIKYDEFGKGIEVDWNNPQIISFLLKFIRVFGKKYDGDVRIAYLECGLLGHWGEWHTWPNEERMANTLNQQKIIKQFSKYFKRTKLLVRYPNKNFLKSYNVGFHDDSFCFSTKKFLSQMQKSGLTERYKACPIGGEVRPEEQESLNNSGKSSENFDDMVKLSHCSWLLNQGAFTHSNQKVVTKLSSSLGYDFFVSEVTVDNKHICFTIQTLELHLFILILICMSISIMKIQKNANLY